MPREIIGLDAVVIIVAPLINPGWISRQTVIWLPCAFMSFINLKAIRLQSIKVYGIFQKLSCRRMLGPLAPSLGREWHVPGPAIQDGLSQTLWNAHQAKHSKQIVADCVTLWEIMPAEVSQPALA